MGLVLSGCSLTFHLKKQFFGVKYAGLFAGRIFRRGLDRVRLTRPDPVIIENLLTRPDSHPSREISNTA